MKDCQFGISPVNYSDSEPGCKTTEDGWRLEISDLGSRGIELSYMLSDGLWTFLGEIESDNLTVSKSEIITFDFHCL